MSIVHPDTSPCPCERGKLCTEPCPDCGTDLDAIRATDFYAQAFAAYLKSRPAPARTREWNAQA